LRESIIVNQKEERDKGDKCLHGSGGLGNSKIARRSRGKGEERGR